MSSISNMIHFAYNHTFSLSQVLHLTLSRSYCYFFCLLNTGLCKFVTEIIEGMVKKNLEVDAVHIAYTFRIDRFNPRRLLTSFLLNSRESLKKRNEKSEGSLAAVVILQFHSSTDRPPSLISLTVSSS